MTCPALSIAFVTFRRVHFMPTLFGLLIACGFASAGTPKTKPLPWGLTDREAAGLNGDASTDVHAASNYSSTIYGLLKAGKFERLDCIAASVRSNKETFSGGMWKLHAIYSGLATPPLHPTQEDWKTHMKLLQRWVSTRPKSITARIALAESYVNYGWYARGSGFSDTVSDSGWKLFAERAAKGKEVLEQASDLPTKDPEWYFAMQNVALAQRWESDASKALLDQAIKFEPNYYYYYRAYANSVLPKWGGEEGVVEQFLQTAADRIGGDAGDALYFRVASYIVCRCPNEPQLKVSWPRIQKGFAAVEKQYGPSPENWNLLARTAYSLDDADVADKMFTRIGDQESLDLWQLDSTFQGAKQWARQVGPMMAWKHAAEEPAEANLQTPEGQRYKSEIQERIGALLQTCSTAPAANAPSKYELLLKVGKAGTVDDVMGLGFSPAAFCLHNKLAEFRQAKEVVFPPPPQQDYWVRFDVISENSAAAALK